MSIILPFADTNTFLGMLERIALDESVYSLQLDLTRWLTQVFVAFWFCERVGPLVQEKELYYIFIKCYMFIIVELCADYDECGIIKNRKRYVRLHNEFGANFFPLEKEIPRA